MAYHTIEDSVNFEKQLKLLRSKYAIISIVQLKEYLENKKNLPIYPLLITFDDGDESVFKAGMPVLKENNCPAILFVISGLINTNTDFWWNTVIKNEIEYGSSHYETSRKISYLKQVSNKERIKELDNYNPRDKAQLTSSQLKCLDKNNICIANHSHTHPMFDQCSEEEINYELSSSKKMFRDWNIGEFDVFAYPNGNYDKVSERILSKRGVKIAFLFDHKINQPVINPLRVSRIRVSADTGLTEFEAKVSGIHPFIYSVFK
ncbi:polysaccharide deacetylase family protein [Salegentibacter holothuriorum]|uniref:polysaccharide deacetylase family protein n=1 Tax=Salegentibacter holothuriorum TaxID=241145 RepID=UPI00158FBF27|nr:polysaccharide deacetylase family protein [Salegentibacter holothuriorum]